VADRRFYPGEILVWLIKRIGEFARFYYSATKEAVTVLFRRRIQQVAAGVRPGITGLLQLGRGQFY
jgi:hypothetical protein